LRSFFWRTKRFIKKKWHENEDFIAREFKMFIEWCVDVVGDDEHIAKNHFRHAGISITYYEIEEQIGKKPWKYPPSCFKTFLSPAGIS